MESLYSTPEWRDLRERVLARDGHRCTVARLLGGLCTDRLDVHHLIPVEEGGEMLPDLDGLVTACSAHHRTLHALRRFVMRRRRIDLPPCRHQHRYQAGRDECRERRLRQLLDVA